MPRQRHEAEFPESMTVVFTALITALASRRWAEGAFEDEPRMPRVGRRYVNQRGSVLRRGRVLECLRPVSLTLYETLFDSPCRVRLRFRWRVEPTEAGSLLRLELRYDLNGAASFRRRHWNGRLYAHCGRIFGSVRACLVDEARQGAGDAGQSDGSNSIVTTNMTALRGKPSLR